MRQRHLVRLLPLGLLLILATLVACQIEAFASIDSIVPLTPTLPASSPSATTPALPAVVYTVAAPTGAPAAAMAETELVSPPSFAALSPEQIAATSAAAIPTATLPPPVTPTNEPDAPTTTPQPTFTPPALPLTLAAEHYWLRRPIPEGGTVWTDKVYPYGSTKGGALQPHHGVEFYVATGTPVLAAASGTVLFAGADDTTIAGPVPNFYGNVIIVELDSRYGGQSVYNLYGHLSEVQITAGQHVDVLQQIALSGATGVADGPHLHFEVRVGQNSYQNTRNPLLWLYPFPDFGTVAGRITWPNGELVHEAPVQVRRIDAPSRYLATTTYADGDLNADEQWQENFAIDDVPAGYYEIVVDTGGKKYTQEFWVFPYRTAFIELQLD